jgi:nitrogen fixation protein NifX
VTPRHPQYARQNKQETTMATGTHLKVAFTTNSLVHVDAGFADARQVVFYQVTREGASFMDVVNLAAPPRPTLADSQTGDAKPGAVTPGKGRNGGCCMAADLAADAASPDGLTARVAALAGCSILITRGISDLAAMRVHSADIFPVKTERLHEIDEVLERLRVVLSGRPPLWVRRALRDAQGRAVPLEEQAL